MHTYFASLRLNQRSNFLNRRTEDRSKSIKKDSRLLMRALTTSSYNFFLILQSRLLKMTQYFFFTIQNGIAYQQLKKPLTFSEDPHGLSNWTLRLPLTIYSQNLYEKHVFREDSVTISSHSDPVEDEKWKYFVTTSHDGTHLYCTAQVFYEKGFLSKCLKFNSSQADPLSNSTQEFYLPRCLILTSDQPYFKMHVNLLRIYRQILKARPSVSHPVNPRVISNYLTLKAQGHREDFTISQTFEPLKNAKIEAILDYYISKINEHRQGESILLQKESNFPILHLYKMKSNEIFQFSHFFNLPISSHTVSALLTAILLEKQIIVASKSSNLNVMIIQSLLEMVRPLKWQHMIVHNLPPHLLDAANENFMPFIVGVNKKYLDIMNTDSKFILIVEEDRLIEPEQMPPIGPALDNFSKLLPRTSSPSISNERYILQHAIYFICQLLKPLLSGDDSLQSNSFYSEFTQTLICEYFIERVDKLELSQFISLLEIESEEERRVKIEREITELTYYFHNPKFVFNQYEWIQYYLERNDPAFRNEKKGSLAKMVTLKEIKQSIINENGQCKINKKASAVITRIRSHSAMQPRSKSGQKIKVSVMKHDQCHPLLNELLEQRLGVASK